VPVFLSLQRASPIMRSSVLSEMRSSRAASLRVRNHLPDLRCRAMGAQEQPPAQSCPRRTLQYRSSQRRRWPDDAATGLRRGTPRRSAAWAGIAGQSRKSHWNRRSNGADRSGCRTTACQPGCVSACCKPNDSWHRGSAALFCLQRVAQRSPQKLRHLGDLGSAARKAMTWFQLSTAPLGSRASISVDEPCTPNFGRNWVLVRAGETDRMA